MSLTFLQLRTKVAQLSGRYDLVDPDDYSDNGMDFHIQAAQDWLDRHKNTPRSMNRVWSEVAAGTYYVNFTRCRKIDEVWINNATDRAQLEKKDYVELKNLYPGLVSATDQGTPLYYAPGFLRSTDDTDIDSLGTFFNNVLDDSETYSGILMLPPPDETVVVEVKGLFYADILSVDADTNFWSINYPHIFVMAVLRDLEIFNRNTEGTRDWEEAINKALLDVEYDMVDEEIDEINQIEG